jgi:hypothetical protein|tara:strand:+ start:2138 stop:3181 length:1044 start_codon:yes stop_codon:yes gene_type:complete
MLLDSSMIKEIKYILLLLLIGNIAFSQNSISVTAQQDTILIGDHLIIDVVLRTDNVNDLVSIDFTGWRDLINLAYPGDTINLEKNTAAVIIGNNEWGISDQYFSTPVEAMEGWFKNGNTITKQIKISIYDYGIWVLPSPKITNKSGKRYPELEPARIWVIPANMGMAQDSIELMPIKYIITEGESWEDYKIWFYLLGFALLAPLLIKLFWGRKKDEEITVEKEIIIPAHKKALTALQSLKSKELWQSGNIKKYQSELTDIVRRYLGDRFNVNALEMTTDEISRALRNKDFDTKHSVTLQRILTIADLVKFAKATPPLEINAEFMDEAVAFVESTKKEDVEDLKTDMN